MARLRRDEDGFTLIELMIAMGLSLIILSAALLALEGFTRNAAQQTRATDANDQVRQAMDRTVTDLRGASILLNAGSTDLAYYVPETTGYRLQRLCLSSNVLYRFTSTSATVPAAPVAACSTGTKVATLKSTSVTGFTYDGASSSSGAAMALVKNVGVTISLDSSADGRTGASVLQASASRRSAGTLPLTDGDVTVTCNSGGAMLNLNASIPGVAGLTVTYSATGGISASGTGVTPVQLTIPTSVTTILAKVTDAAGVTNTISKDVQCAT